MWSVLFKRDGVHLRDGPHLSLSITNRQIHQLVYQYRERHLRLYGMTEEEIRIVEGMTRIKYCANCETKQVFVAEMESDCDWHLAIGCSLLAQQG